MKKLLYLIILFSGIANADDFNISASFRAKLMQSTSGNGIARNQNGNSIKIDANGDNYITYAEALEVWQLVLTNSNINSLEGIEYFINIRTLICNNNNDITVLHLEALVNLTTINCGQCSLVSLTFAPNSGLTTLNCNNNQLMQLNITGMASLTNLVCDTNNLIVLDFTGCTLLQNIYCSHNNLLTIDVSGQFYLNDLDCSNNALLSMFVKNGKNETIAFNGGGNNGLLYICADEIQIPILQGQLSSNPMCVVNSFCTDTPGGFFNTIKGNVSLDNLSPKSYIKMKCTIGGTILETTTNADGDYVFYTTETGSFTVSLAAENPNAYNNSLPISGSFPGANPFIGNFNLQASSAVPYNDVEMVIAPTFSSQGQKSYLVTIKNKGNVSAAGIMKINFNDSALDFPATPPILPAGIEFDSYIPNSGISKWKYTTPLEPCESKSFKLTFSIVNDLIPFNVNTNITSSSPMVTPNNVFALQQGIVDAVVATNTIECLEGTTVDQSQIGNYLHYMINLQNDGAGVANTIVIENTFNETKYDINSLQIVGSTLESNNALPHPVQLDVKGNKATYSFRKAGNGGPGGQGTVGFKIKTKDNLLPGSSVTNNVIVNFEYDTPINVVGNATTFTNLNVADNQLDKTINVYPNPATVTINVTGKNNIQSVQIYDVQGRLLQTNLGYGTNYSIDIADKANGVYFLKVTSDKVIKVERVVKE
jgi:hypothetical protein